MEEIIKHREDIIRCWPTAKPGNFIFGTNLGSIIITNKTFYFISTGGSGFSERLIFGWIVGNAIGGAETRNLELESKKNEGSIIIPINKIAHCEVKHTWDRRNYIILSFQDDQGILVNHSFEKAKMSKIKIMEDLALAIVTAKKEVSETGSNG
jgi:hypothetical protein